MRDAVSCLKNLVYFTEIKHYFMYQLLTLINRILFVEDCLNVIELCFDLISV